MKWTPDKFWSATFYEVSCAYVGHCQAKGIGHWAPDRHGMTADDREALRLETESLKARFPDGPKPRKKKQKREGAP